METPSILSIHSLGAVSFQVGDSPAETLTSQKSAALMVYLAYLGQPRPRSHLSALLWHDCSADQGMASLRMVLTNLRKPYAPFMEISRLVVGLKMEWIRLDAHELSDAVSAFKYQQDGLTPAHVNHLHALLNAYRGELLRDFYGASPAFTMWLRTARTEMRARFCEGTLLLARYLSQHGQHAEALSVLERALHFEPRNSAIHAELLQMRFAGYDAFSG